MPELTQLLTLSDQVVAPPLDTLRETARTRDRRRTTLLASASVAVVAIAIAAGLGLGGPDRSAPEPAPQPVDDSRPLTYAEGSTIRYGERRVEAPGAVTELDLTDDGVVFSTPDTRVWFTDGTAVEELGRVGQPPPSYAEDTVPLMVPVGWIVSDNLGSTVAWLEFTDPQEPEVVVYDTRDREVVGRAPTGAGPGHTVALHSAYADSAYWYVDAGPDTDPAPDVRLDLASGERTTLTEEDYARQMRARGPDRRVLLGSGPPATVDGIHLNFKITEGRFEPQGAQPLVVEDARTGLPLAFDAPKGYPPVPTVFLFQWLDDDTVGLVMLREQGEDLFVCSIAGQSCEHAVSGEGNAFVVPDMG
jgi:hypothetical protein